MNKAKTCQLFIDDKSYRFEVEGIFFWGENELLFNTKDSIISKMTWSDVGYNIVKIFDEDEFLRLKESITKNIINAIGLANINFNSQEFTLEKYHKIVTNDELHNIVINTTRNLENSNFDFDIEMLVKKFENILGFKLTSWIEELKKSHIQIRINRPHSLDINPPHRDGYLSYWKDIINVWIPIEGCNKNSSLPVFPKSHLIPENKIFRTKSKGAKINGNTYFVPCILKTNMGELKMLRPNPKYGEALIFSPYLIHGAAINNNENETRVSLELRFPRVKN